jgi:lauroyl/myristoyl acyltransferase
MNDDSNHVVSRSEMDTTPGFWGAKGTLSSRKSACPGFKPVLLEDSTVLKLFPLVSRTVNSNECSIVRVGGPTLTAISTSVVGLKAVRLMQRGLSVGEVKAALKEEHGSEETDIEPLIRALFAARIIHSANRIPVNEESSQTWTALLQKTRWMGFAARRALVKRILNWLPLRVAYPLLVSLHPRLSRPRLVQSWRQVRYNAQEIFGASLVSRQLEKIADDWVAEHIRRNLDVEILNAYSHYRVTQWIRRAVTVSGLEKIDAALANKKGVLLSSFHFSSAHLITLVLWLHGYSFTGAGGITRAAANKILPFDDLELQERVGGCGRVKWFGNYNFENVLSICRTVANGGMALVYPDSIWTRPKKEVAKYFHHEAAHYRPATTQVPFLGRMMEANKGVPWIYKQCEAPLIPLRLTRISNARFHLTVNPELKLNRNGSVEEITAELYQSLEREVCLDPAAWSYLWLLRTLFIPTDSRSHHSVAL